MGRDVLGYDVPESVYWTFNNLLLDDKLATEKLNGINVLTQRRPYKVSRQFQAGVLNVVRDAVPGWHSQLWALVMYFKRTFEELEGYTTDDVHRVYRDECEADLDGKVLPLNVRRELIGAVC